MLLLSAREFSHFSLAVTALVPLIAALLIVTALQVQKRGRAAAENAYTEGERRGATRIIWW